MNTAEIVLPPAWLILLVKALGRIAVLALESVRSALVQVGGIAWAALPTSMAMRRLVWASGCSRRAAPTVSVLTPTNGVRG
ncbi:hypothetical protein D3C86_1233940 [compost metagenome]